MTGVRKERQGMNDQSHDGFNNHKKQVEYNSDYKCSIYRPEFDNMSVSMTMMTVVVPGIDM